MELIQHWAGISFSAQNGDPEGLLTAAAAGSLPLSDVVPRPGGFSARCAAWHYRKLAALARKRRVRLRIQKRCGLFFRLRPLFRRRGLWAGCLVFLPLLLWLQGFVWFIEPVGLTPGQQARAAVILWEAGLSREMSLHRTNSQPENTLCSRAASFLGQASTLQKESWWQKQRSQSLCPTSLPERSTVSVPKCLALW